MPEPLTTATPAEPENDWKITFYLMMAVQLIMGMSLTVIAPLLPLFLPTIGVTGERNILIWTGLLTSANLFAAAAASPVWGVLADRYGRKAMVMRSSASICLFTAMMIFTHNVWMLFAIRLMMGAFAGFGSAANTLVATRVPSNRLGFALGWVNTAQMIGTFLGPLIGGLLVDWLHSYNIAFLWTSSLALVVLILVWRFVPDDRRSAVPHHEAPLPRRRWSSMLVTVLPFFILLLIAQIALRSVQPIITLTVAALVPGAHNIATLAGLAFAVAGFADLLGSPLLSKRSDRIGYRRVLLIALLGSAAFTAPQAIAGSYSIFLAERFGVGLFVSSIIPTAQALLAKHSDAKDRGLMYGIGASATFLGGGLGPLIGGYTAAEFGTQSVFVMTAGMLLVAFAWVAWRLPDPFRATPAERFPA